MKNGTPYAKGASIYLPLKTIEKIRKNNYTLENTSTGIIQDYCKEEIDELWSYRQNQRQEQAEKEANKLELEYHGLYEEPEERKIMAKEKVEYLKKTDEPVCEIDIAVAELPANLEYMKTMMPIWDKQLEELKKQRAEAVASDSTYKACKRHIKKQNKMQKAVA